MEESVGSEHVANKGPKMKSSHPTYMVMVKEALQALKERNGSSRQKITKFIISNHLVSPDLTKVNYHVSLTLKKAVADGSIIQTTGKGASGSFKLAKAEKDALIKKAKEAGKEKPAAAKKNQKTKPKPAQRLPTGKTPSKITKKAAVAARRRMSSANAISAVMSTPRHPKSAKKAAPRAPKGSPRAQNATFTLSLSEESSQDDLPDLEIDEKQKKKRATPKTKPKTVAAAKTTKTGAAASKAKPKAAAAKKSTKAAVSTTKQKPAAAKNKTPATGKKATTTKSPAKTKKPAAAKTKKPTAAKTKQQAA